MSRLLLTMGLSLCLISWGAMGDPPTELDYQGKILVDDQPLQGDGYFKFALSDAGGTTNYWSNDGATTGEPSTSVTNELMNGVFSVSLGDSGMQAMDRGVFSNGGDLYLRVWFSEDNLTFSELLPRQKMVSHGYAVNADQVDGLDASALIASAVAGVTLSGDVIGDAATNAIAPGVIVDADIDSSAGIAPSKIAGTSLVETTVFGGDVTGVYTNLVLGAGVLPGADTGTAGIVQMAGGFDAAAPYLAIDDSDRRLNAFGVVNTITAAAPNSVLTVVGTGAVTVSNTPPGTLQIGLVPAPVLANTVYVALNGTPAGPGTMAQPYDTAQAGYDAAAANFPGLPSAVVLMGGGNYGPLTMHAGTVHVLGESRSELDGVTVIMGVPSPPFPGGPVASGKQRVENVIVLGPAFVQANGFGAWVKFHNCRFLDGLIIEESYVEVQHCAIQTRPLVSPAVTVGTGVPITEIGIYQSSILSVDTNVAPGAVPGTLMVMPGVMDFEVIGCQIANEGAAMGGTGPAIRDLSPPIPPPMPLHLYSHNVIKGPATGTGDPAVADSILGAPPPPAPTIVFTHNTVYGDVGGIGGVGLPAASPQYYANNSIYGIINFPAPGAPTGWAQAGAGPGLDAAGNTEHPVGWAPGGMTLPSHWDD